MASRMVDSARKVLNRYLPDVYIYTDVVRGKEAGRSPGFGLTLVSESTSGTTHAAETSTYSIVTTTTNHAPATDDATRRKRKRAVVASDDEKVGPGSWGQDGQRVLPEDIGQSAAFLLLEEIVKGGCVDSCCQVLPLLFMVLGQRDVSKIQLGHLSPYTIQFLRHLKQFFQVTFNVQSKREELKEDGEDGEDSFGLAAMGRKAQAELTREVVTLSCVGIGYSNFSKGIM